MTAEVLFWIWEYFPFGSVPSWTRSKITALADPHIELFQPRFLHMYISYILCFFCPCSQHARFSTWIPGRPKVILFTRPQYFLRISEKYRARLLHNKGYKTPEPKADSTESTLSSDIFLSISLFHWQILQFQKLLLNWIKFGKLSWVITTLFFLPSSVELHSDSEMIPVYDSELNLAICGRAIDRIPREASILLEIAVLREW